MNKSYKNITIVMVITIVSKCAGFLRDIILAYYYGTSDVTDAFYIAQTIPEFLFILVVQAISVGFIPIFIDIKERQSESEANQFTNNVIKICLLLSFFLIIFVNVFSKQIVRIFASGFEGSKAELTIQFTEIIVFSMIFRIVVCVYSSYLNANGHFVKPALNGVILDVVSIIAIIVSSFTSEIVLVYGIILATFAQFVLLYSSVVKTKPPMTLTFNGMFNDDIRKMMRMLLPVILGVGANQINALADRTMASSIDGAVSALNYASKVNYIFENIIVLSLATVMFPRFSKNVSSDNFHGLKNDIKHSTEIVSFTMIPCTFLFYIFSDIVVRILFERGAFNYQSIESTSIAMKYYSVGLFFMSVNVVFTRALYALKKVRVVSIISCVTVGLNILCNILLKPIMGIGGLALATSISNIFGTILLVCCLKFNFTNILFDIIPELIRALLSSALLAVFAMVVSRIIDLNNYVYFIITVLAFTLLYLLLEYLLKSETIIYLSHILKDEIGIRCRDDT